MADYSHDLSDNQRRAALIELRTIYVEACGPNKESRRRAVETAMMILTAPLDSHGDLFADGEWEHPCLCAECRSYG